MRSLTRLNLTSLLIVLFATSTAGIAGYLLLLESGHAYHKQASVNLAHSISTAISRQQRRLREIARDERVIELAARSVTAPQETDSLSRWLSKSLPGAINIQFMKNNETINLKTTPARHYTTGLKNALQRTGHPEPQYHANSRIGGHYDLVQPVRAQGITSAALIVSYRLNRFDQFLHNQLPKKTKFEIVYQRTDGEIDSIHKLGKQPADNRHTVLTSAIDNTDWQVRLTIPRSLAPLSVLSWLYIIGISLAIIVIICNSVILYFKTTRTLETDLRTLARLFKDVRAGKVRVDYPLALGEFRQLFNYIRDLGKKMTMEQQAFRDMGLVDHLTQVSNRRHFESQLRDLFNKAGELGPSALLVIDMDHFKDVNDRYGHDAGDVLLVEFSRALKHNVRSTDFVARLGGDEFCIVYTYTTLEKARKLAMLLRQRLPKEIFLPRNRTHPMKWTGGLSIMEKSDGKYDDVLLRADQALYRAKAKGRNNTIVYEQAGQPAKVKRMRTLG